MLESSHLYQETKHELSPHGIRAGNVELDLATMLKRKEQVVTILTRGVDSLFKKNKVTRYLGLARIEGAERVVVGAEKSPIALKAKNILIATASTPATLAS